MKKVITILFLCLSVTGFSQKFLNLDFEYAIPGSNTPQKWYAGGSGYIVALDEIEKASQARSLKMVSNNPAKSQFGVCNGSFPIDLVKGKNIEFKGRIKTEEITGGYAGLWWRVDGKNYEQLGFDNMSDRGLKGTNDWKQVSIKMKVDENVVNINFGALFAGKGTAWFDDFEIFIDGVKFIDIEPRTTVPTNEELTWLKQHIHPLKSYEPTTNSDDDLKILKDMIGESKVVALGETTHGSSEIFKMKHRIIKYLAENAGFNIFSIEANMPESYKLNEYIVNRNGDPVDLIKGMYFWTWRTEEVLGMVEWMKKYNESGKKISFTGFDMQFFSGAIDELDQAYRNQVEIQNLLKELRTGLDEISQERKNSGREVISNEKRNKTVNQIKSLRDYVSGSDKPLSEKSWLLQNIRILEQYLDVSSRDKYMAENLLWIRSQNPGSKIVAWAHNGHIQKTDNRMGMYLSESLKEDYLTIGISFHKGNYTAMGDHGLSAYEAQESYPGTYEYFFNMVDEPVFILDLREAKKQNLEQARWLLDPLPFRSVGAVKMASEFSETDLTEDFDLIIFIRESTSSTLLN